MQIGYSKVDITPPILTCTNGGYYFDPKETHRGVHDPLYARTIVFKKDDMSAAIISLEFTVDTKIICPENQRDDQKALLNTGIKYHSPCNPSTFRPISI